MKGIAEMFTDLNGYEEYQQDIFCWLLRQQSQERTLMAERREWNRRLFRAHWRKSSAGYRERKKAQGEPVENIERRRQRQREYAANKRAAQRAA